MENTVYVVYIYEDYRKEVDIEVLAVFTSRDTAIDYAKDLCTDKDESDDLDVEAEYVTAIDAIFDGYCPSRGRRLAVQETKLIKHESV
jgi:hypothetical protein